MNRTVAIHSLGCKVNSYEAESMEQLLKQAGYTIVPFDENITADIYIINTCSVTNIADRKSRQMLHKSKKINPDAIVVAAGCYVNADTKKAAEDNAVDIVLGNNCKINIVEALENYYKDKNNSEMVVDFKEKQEYEELKLDEVSTHTRAYIKIQDGCNQFCSYCIIPYTRGRIRSRDIDEIEEEVTKLVSKGFKEVVLTGIHLTSYGVDNNKGSLLEVIMRLDKIEGLQRIRLGSLEPGIITEEFVERISSNSKVCPHFHLSLQSGCDSVLKRMNRKYTCEQYFEKCDMLRKAYKSPALTTDVIVGFPGETEEEFAETVRYLTELNLYEMHIFKYSPRKGTVAAVMKEQVAPEIKNERSDVLLKLAHDNKTAYEAQFEGCELEVLVEEVVKKDNKTYLRGHTERYMDILIDVGDISMPESFVNSFVYVTYTQNGGNLPLLL